MRTALALLFLVSFSLRADEVPIERVVFSADEKASILSHGPWPQPARRDPSNRVSGKPEAIALGERLFFEPRLSGTGTVLCATCHAPFRAFQDARPRGFGLEEVERNTPSLFNAGLYRWYGWDGAHDSLWSQSLRPLLDAREMRASPGHVADVVRNHLAADYAKAFGREVPVDEQEVLADVGKALAAYQETLVSARTPFDEFRDALAKNASIENYPLAARRGARIFAGKGNCSGCHFGPQFTNATRRVEPQHRDFGEFRVPALRGVAQTAPYMHDGSVASLRDAVKHYPPLELTPKEIDDLVAFLETLSPAP